MYVRDVACPACGTVYRLYGPAPGPVTEIYGFLTCEVCGATVTEVPSGGWHLERKTGDSNTNTPESGTDYRTVIENYLLPTVVGGVLGCSVTRCNPTGAAIGAILGIPVYRLARWAAGKLANR